MSTNLTGLARARRAVLLVAILAAGNHAAGADDSLSPFLPKAAPAPTVVRVLAPSDFLEPSSIAAFEKNAATTVALDAYANASELAEHGAERYDVVVLRGPALERRLVSGTLTKLDRRRLPNARLVQPILVAKYAAYDRDAAYGVPFGWSAFGLIYNADQAGASPPSSWAQALDPRNPRRAANCGIVWPDAREESFIAAWRLMGVDPAHAKPAEVKSAAALIDRARRTYVAFAAADEVGAFAKGAACLGAGTMGEAEAVRLRSGDNAPNVRFAYAREGTPLEIYAFAIPRDAPSPEGAYRLIDAMLAPETAERNAESAGVIGAEEATDLDQLKRLTPEPVFEAATSAAMQNEWKRLTTGK
jgi:putrescine transport system substrate-binding protein